MAIPMDERRAIYENLVRWAGPSPLDTKGANLLEYGVGKFGFAPWYAESCADVVGLEVADYGKHHEGRPYRFVRYDGNRIPFNDESFDIVASHSVLEHVHDIRQSLSEIDRVLKVGGRAFLTVSPLYFSCWGSHLKADGKRIDNWEHLDPRSPHFMATDPYLTGTDNGQFLNKMTMPEFLYAVGEQPWDIVKMKRTYDPKLPPAGLEFSVTPLDLISKEFRLLAVKSAVKPTVPAERRAMAEAGA